MLRGYLRSNKLYASRNTIREAINIVDPEGREMRVCPPIPRAVYNG